MSLRFGRGFVSTLTSTRRSNLLRIAMSLSIVNRSSLTWRIREKSAAANPVLSPAARTVRRRPSRVCIISAASVISQQVAASFRSRRTVPLGGRRRGGDAGTHEGLTTELETRGSPIRRGGQERPRLSVRSTPAGRRIRKGRAGARFNESLSRIERTSC